MHSNKIKLGIVGVGKIVHDQHLPSIYKNESYELLAVASRNSSLDNVKSYSSIEQMLAATPALEAVALCMQPEGRYEVARLALQKGLHVLLEKPPATSVSEVEQLAELAAQQGVSLFASWHSRHAVAVEKTKSLLAQAQVESVKLEWKENVRKWHKNQEWVWQAGSLGVFDAGINGLSILTHILAEPIFAQNSQLIFPNNKAAPIAAKMALNTPSSIPIEAIFDWRHSGSEQWNIEVVTDQGIYELSQGGAVLTLNGNSVDGIPAPSKHAEYQSIYAHFAELIENSRSDVDVTPLKLTEDAFKLGERASDREFID